MRELGLWLLGDNPLILGVRGLYPTVQKLEVADQSYSENIRDNSPQAVLLCIVSVTQQRHVDQFESSK